MNKKFFLIFLTFSFSVLCQSQENLIKTYGSENCDYRLILYSNFSYLVSYTEEIAEDILGEYVITAGKWLLKSDTLCLNDTIHAEGNINRKEYNLLMLGEYEAINLSLDCYPINDSLHIVGLRDLKNKWIFNGQITLGKMTGVKVDLKENVAYKLEEGEIIETLEIK